jgi:hypothetical protein
MPLARNFNLQKVQIKQMKKTTQLIKTSLFAASVIAACWSVPARAAETNAVQTINLQLTLLTQGPFHTNSPATNDISATATRTTIATKDVIGWLGTATSNHFSLTAKLVRVRHFNAATNQTTIEIRDGTNAPVDVSAFFSNTFSSEKVDESIYNRETGLRTGTLFENLHLDLTNAPPHNLVAHFNVLGSARLSYVSVTSGKTVLVADDITATGLAGAGAGPDGVLGLMTGSVIINGTVREVK